MARRTRNRTVTLTEACRKLVLELEADLRLAIDEDSELAAGLKAEWKEATDQNRTGKTLDAWTGDLVTQVAVSWVLSCVFVRFVEDNDLIGRPLLSGPTSDDPAESRQLRARDAEQAYYREHPDHAEREYLKYVFAELATLPGMAELFDQRHALFWRITPRIEGGRRLIEFFRTLDDETGQVRWRFTGSQRDTRFLGDLYQDLSESARKAYALLQTPVFVEEFILDRTLEPALDTFGLEGFRMIDPTCGSGHFLLGAFERVLDRWRAEEPGGELRDLVARALDAVNGVDVNPFAVAISRFRLLVRALAACEIDRLNEAPNFHVHVAVGDSLLHGPKFSEMRGIQTDLYGEFDLGHVYPFEVEDELRQVLGRQYHAVVGNPPYIRPKDKALKQAYRQKYGACYREFSLSVPFMERFVDLAIDGRRGGPAGYVGQITSNSFMKREFGKKLIEQYFPNWDLTTVVDSSGADIPGHGTPTVILVHRNQPPVAGYVRAVLGIRGEPSTPEDPAKGQVWSSIVALIDQPGAENEFISVEDRERTAFHLHPWSIGGGGAAQLMEAIRSHADKRLGDVASEVGFIAMTRADDLFVGPPGWVSRYQPGRSVVFVEGDRIRDWSLADPSEALFPYEHDTLNPCPWDESPRMGHLFWCHRSLLRTRKEPNGTHEQIGRAWWEWSRFQVGRFRIPMSIAFAFVATHNHFVLDRGGKVFKQSAPVIKLPKQATEDDYYALLAVLNSSLACFWMKQVFYPKASSSGDISTEKGRPEANRYEIAATGLEEFPLAEATGNATPWFVRLGRRLQVLGDTLAQETPENLLRENADCDEKGLAAKLETQRVRRARVREAMHLLQEELDWATYSAYGLLDGLPTATGPVLPDNGEGDPAAGIVPPDDHVLGARREACAASRGIALIETPVHKRLWLGRQGVYGSARTSWPELVADGLDAVMLDRMEEALTSRPISANQLAELLTTDERFMQLLRLRTGQEAPSAERTIASLLVSEAVPYLPVLYLQESGLRKRADWETTWELQHLEDPLLEQQEEILALHFGGSLEDRRRAREHVACWKTSSKLSKERGLTIEEEKSLTAVRHQWKEIDAERRHLVGGETPPVPPKYKPADFLDQRCWRMRGKLDVPKERFIAYPFCSSEGDDSLLVGWAGWDHEQRATALAQVLQERKDQGWAGDRLAPILAGLDQLVPWLKQWHDDLGAEYERFIESEATREGLTLEAIRAWRPPQVSRRRGRGKAAARSEGE